MPFGLCLSDCYGNTQNFFLNSGDNTLRFIYLFGNTNQQKTYEKVYFTHRGIGFACPSDGKRSRLKSP